MKKLSGKIRTGLSASLYDLGFASAVSLAVGALFFFLGDLVLAEKGKELVWNSFVGFWRQFGDGYGASRMVRATYLSIEFLYLVYFLIGLAAELGPKALEEGVETPVWRIYGIIIGFMVAGGSIWISGEILGLSLSARWAGGAITVLGPPIYLTWRLFRRAQHEARHGIDPQGP